MARVELYSLMLKRKNRDNKMDYNLYEIKNRNKVSGHIYLITNKINNKKYVGQTRSHRLNHKKYRPFGYIGRLKDHISEALCNTKKNQCKYLNNAIRKYGKEKFDVELLLICDIKNLNMYEKLMINTYNTFYPCGYNLTKGGQTTCSANIELDDFSYNEYRKRISTNVQNTSLEKRLKRYSHVNFDNINQIDELKKYISKRFKRNKEFSYYRIKFPNEKYDIKFYKSLTDTSIENVYQRAFEFLTKLYNRGNN